MSIQRGADELMVSSPISPKKVLEMLEKVEPPATVRWTRDWMYSPVPRRRGDYARNHTYVIFCTR